MKQYKILSAVACLMMAVFMASCNGEKSLITIEDDLPIKSQTLYMVGDATPNGWSIDSPTALAPATDNPLVFAWEGTLYAGELKLCLVPGSWDNPFIRPAQDQREINKNNITDETFIMHAGDPDEKWRVTEAGKYRLTFNLRTWKMSTEYLGGIDVPEVEPIEGDEMFIVGDATPHGWDIGDPNPLTKVQDYTFVYEGNLRAGEMKACMSAGSWDVPFVRPASAGVKINKNGVESADFVYTNNPDEVRSEEAGKYKLTFDVKNWKIEAQYLGEAEPETPKFYIVGDATPNGWDIGNPTELEMVEDGVYVYNGVLKGKGDGVDEAAFKACRTKGDWGAAFFHPTETTEVGTTEVKDCAINEYVGDPDIKWVVSKTGYYHLVFDLKNNKMSAQYVGEAAPTLYIVGDATPNGWSIDNPTALEMVEEGVFVYDGELKTEGEGAFKACRSKGSWDNPFIHPTETTELGDEAITDQAILEYAGDPDIKWVVKKAGKYHLVFNMNDMTFSAALVE